MHPYTGHLIQAAAVEALSKQEQEEYVPLTEDQYVTAKNLNSNQRKGYMRNQPCPCGSGKKFKRCHWGDTKDLVNAVKINGR